MALLGNVASMTLRGWLGLEAMALRMAGTDLCLCSCDHCWNNSTCNSEQHEIGIPTQGPACDAASEEDFHLAGLEMEITSSSSVMREAESTSHDHQENLLSLTSQRRSRQPCCLATSTNAAFHMTMIPRSRLGRCIVNVVVLVLGAALVSFYAFVHVHIIQEDGVFFTTWFYEWFLIPVLLSFVFAAPLHRALGFDNSTRANENTCTSLQECWRRVGLLERDPTTQRLIAAVAVCYVAYIVGDAGFFIPFSPNRHKLSTYPIYILAVVTNICFIYQGFLLTILAMRAVAVRLRELEQEVAHTLQHIQQIQLQSTCTTATTNKCHQPPVSTQQILQWATCYHEIRQDVFNLSRHFGLRMVVGLTMFVVEVTNMILNVWEAVGSTLTTWQTLLLLLTYAANAAILIMVVFHTAYTHTMCAERIGPQLALISLRTTTDDNGQNKAELNVLAQTLMQAPIHLRIGNFHVTAEYANALTAWFFGLFAIVFGLKVPNI